MEEWQKYKKTVKVVNLERPGDDIYVGCQGEGYLIKDGATVTIPELVIENLRLAVKKAWKVEGNINSGKSQTQYDKPRFLVVEVDPKKEDPSADESKKKKTEILNKIHGKDEDFE